MGICKVTIYSDITLLHHEFNYLLNLFVIDDALLKLFLKIFQFSISVECPGSDANSLKRDCSRRNYLLSEPSPVKDQCSTVEQSLSADVGRWESLSGCL